MSWSITNGEGREKAELFEQVDKYFDSMIASNTTEPFASEYKNAKAALIAAISALPDGAKYLFDTRGHAHDWMSGETRHVGGEFYLSIRTAQ